VFVLKNNHGKANHKEEHRQKRNLGEEGPAEHQHRHQPDLSNPIRNHRDNLPLPFSILTQVHLTAIFFWQRAPSHRRNARTICAAWTKSSARDEVEADAILEMLRRGLAERDYASISILWVLSARKRQRHSCGYYHRESPPCFPEYQFAPL